MPLSGAKRQRRYKTGSKDEDKTCIDRLAYEHDGNEVIYSGDVLDVRASTLLAFAKEAGMPLPHRSSVTQKRLEAQTFANYIAHAGSFRYHRKLLGHRSCVNTIAFSRGQGRWLADAGDDLRIYVRDMLQDVGQADCAFPVLQLYGHQSNVFSLSWSAQNSYLYSAGSDGLVFQHDLEHSPVPLLDPTQSRPRTRRRNSNDSLGAHNGSVPEVSSHPTNPHLVLSCDDCGMLKLLDTRISKPCVAHTGRATAPFCSVQWNPSEMDGNTFAAATTSPISGSTRLYDIRQCFNASRDGKIFTAKDAVVNYHTDLLLASPASGYSTARATTNSVAFDPSGKLLASSLSLFHPTLYAVGDPDPLAVLTSNPLDDFLCEPVCRSDALRSSSTVKHGSFGFQSQLNKLHYAIGSDDSRTYVFEIPEIDTLKARREVIDLSSWVSESVHRHNTQTQADRITHTNSDSGSVDSSDNEDRLEHEVLYTQGSPSDSRNVIRPIILNKPTFVLAPVRSIVNVTAFHPELMWIATAGIENNVHLYSAAPFVDDRLRRYEKSINGDLEDGTARLSETVHRYSQQSEDEAGTSPSSSLEQQSAYDEEEHPIFALSPSYPSSSSDDADSDIQYETFDVASSDGSDWVADNVVGAPVGVPAEIGQNDAVSHGIHAFLAAMRNDPLYVANRTHTDTEMVPTEATVAQPEDVADARAPAQCADEQDDSEDDDWSSDLEDRGLSRLQKYAAYPIKYGQAATYHRLARWATKKDKSSMKAEGKRVLLFDHILREDEWSRATDSFVSCSLNIPHSP